MLLHTRDMMGLIHTGLRGCYIQGMGWGLVHTGVRGLLHTWDGMGAGTYRG